jgi:hypothetical protein
MLDTFVSNNTWCSERIKSSPMLETFDLDNESQVSEIYELLSNKRESVEWWTYMFGSYNDYARQAVEAGDAITAAFASACAERCRSMIMYKDHFEDVVWMGHSAKRLVTVIQKWHANKENSNEEFWQQLFLENAYVLSQLFSSPVVFQKDKAYVGGMSYAGKDAKLVDYLFAHASSNDAILVEIKTPTTQLMGKLLYRNGVSSASADLSGSIVQVLNYRRSLIRNLVALNDQSERKVEAFNPKCILIIGNTSQLNTAAMKDSFEVLRSSLKEVELVTFDELFTKAETLAALFNLRWQSNA